MSAYDFFLHAFAAIGICATVALIVVGASAIIHENDDREHGRAPRQ